MNFRSFLQPDETDAPGLALTYGAMVALGHEAGQLRGVRSSVEAGTHSLVFLGEDGGLIGSPAAKETGR